MILNNARLEKELDLAEISKKLKVPVKYLEAIESENISCFPQEPYCSLIVKDYADFLGLNGKEILSFFRRDFEQKRKSKSEQKKFFSFTPQFTFTLAIGILLVVFSFYLVGEYIKFNSPPFLKVNWPSSSLLTQGSSFDISGITDPEATISINGDLVLVDANGKFQKKIEFSTGEAKIKVESKSPSGKTTVDQKVLK
jgi:hypothetical protein